MKASMMGRLLPDFSEMNANGFLFRNTSFRLQAVHQRWAMMREFETRDLDLLKSATDPELLGIFVDTRSAEAAELLVRRHGPLVAGLVRRMLSDSNDAEDAYQATFVILLKSASKIRNRRSLSAWLYGVAYRTACRIRLRAKERRMNAMERIESMEEKSPVDPLEKIATESQLEQLDRELQKLKPVYREVLIEHHLLGFSVPQIAERLDLSNSAVEGRLRRGRIALRERLTRRGISFTVATAMAAVYHRTSAASPIELWQHGFLSSELFSQTVASGQPMVDTPLQHLIQGESVMTSVVASKWSSLALVSVLMAGAVGGLQLLSGRDGDSLVPSIMVATASAEPAQPVEAKLNLPATTTGASEQTPAGTGSKAEPSGQGELSINTKESKVIAFAEPTGPRPNWMTDGGTIAQEEEALREGIRRGLRQMYKPEFNNTPLREVIKQIAASANIPFLLDTIAMEGGSSGATPDDPITLTGLKEMSLQRALKTILEPLDLTYVIEPDYIIVTTKSAGSGRTVRYYDLAYLLPNNEKALELIELIMTMVEANWDVDGGEHSLQLFGSMLVASCPEETHLGIESLLYNLSKMDRENLRVPTKPVGGKEKGGGGMGGGGTF